jgi:flavin-dependent dehydrogenase
MSGYAGDVSSVPHYDADVAVIGAGIAGLAACVFLRQQGLSVVCLDARPYPHHKVGESLDWSSPGLLRRLGIDVNGLIADGIATYKKNIVVYEMGKPEWELTPPAQIGWRPLRFETVTLHVDRTALDLRLFEHARALGAEFIWERATGVDAVGERVNGCVTASGRLVSARWYIDASGTARVFARAMKIPATRYGCPKLCLWTYFDGPPLHEGTAFFVDNRDAYLNWIWDIPISPKQTSVGFVAPADHVRQRRQEGDSVQTILSDELQRYPRFKALLDVQPVVNVESTSFQPYVTTRVCGANWFMAGESASMPDPLTGNGLTSGIRHARHAVGAILAAGASPEIPKRLRRAYDRHVFRLGRSFNAHIERAIYGDSVRGGLGFRAATYIYTFFAFFMNALHARFEPSGTAGMAVFGVMFAGARVWVAGWTTLSRAVLWCRGPVLHGQR